MSTPVTLFIQKPLTNINTLLQKYNIYVHENIDGKTTCYSNYGLKKKTPLYSKYKKKKNTYTRQINNNTITSYQCLFIEIIISKINHNCLMTIYKNYHTIHFFNTIDLLLSQLFTTGYFSNSSGCSCEKCNIEKIQEYEENTGLNIYSVKFIENEIRSLL